MTATDHAYRDWREAVGRQLSETYCITIEDAGFDEPYLVHQWRLNETPGDFVEWFGNKYDLDRRPSPLKP
jgi:hypothetical protein